MWEIGMSGCVAEGKGWDLFCERFFLALVGEVAASALGVKQGFRRRGWKNTCARLQAHRTSAGGGEKEMNRLMKREHETAMRKVSLGGSTRRLRCGQL